MHIVWEKNEIEIYMYISNSENFFMDIYYITIQNYIKNFLTVGVYKSQLIHSAELC